jgi:hypothetical protein
LKKSALALIKNREKPLKNSRFCIIMKQKSGKKGGDKKSLKFFKKL